MNYLRHFFQAHSGALAWSARTVIFTACFALSVVWTARAAAQNDTDSANTPNIGAPAAPGAPAAKPNPITTKPYTPLTGKQKWDRYWKAWYDPRALGTIAVGAGIAQATDAIPEWGQGASGYGCRFGSGYGKHISKTTIRYSLDGLLGFDPRYSPSEKTGFGNRLWDAIAHSFMIRDDTGRWHIGYPNFAAEFGTGAISRAWNPASDRTVGHALASGGVSLGTDVAINVLKEFIRAAR